MQWLTTTKPPNLLNKPPSSSPPKMNNYPIPSQQVPLTSTPPSMESNIRAYEHGGITLAGTKAEYIQRAFEGMRLHPILTMISKYLNVTLKSPLLAIE
jgi:hypothetical protein